MNEFALIDAVVAALGASTAGPGIVVGPGDDCSVAELPEGAQLVSSIDTLVAGVHFPFGAPGELIGHRALGVAVSDLAAMGADPLHVIVSVTLEETQQAWLIDFARGMGEAAQQMGIAVVGGNLARGPLNIAVSAHGTVPKGTALLRSGARPDDRIYVSGCVGAAGLALARLDGARPTIEHLRAMRRGDDDYALARYYLPSPRIALGIALRGIASAAIDVSDGLLADLGHICESSRVGARIEAERIPVAPGAVVESAVAAGDDYELLFTVPAARLAALGGLAADVVEIGVVTRDEGVVLTRGGQGLRSDRTGFRHFS